MNFVPHTQEELKNLNIQEDKVYSIEYLDRDYFNGDENMVKCDARVIKNENGFTFIVTDPYGMDKFINEVRLIQQ